MIFARLNNMQALRLQLCPRTSPFTATRKTIVWVLRSVKKNSTWSILGSALSIDSLSQSCCKPLTQSRLKNSSRHPSREPRMIRSPSHQMSSLCRSIRTFTFMRSRLFNRTSSRMYRPLPATIWMNLSITSTRTAFKTGSIEQEFRLMTITTQTCTLIYAAYKAKLGICSIGSMVDPSRRTWEIRRSLKSLWSMLKNFRMNLNASVGDLLILRRSSSTRTWCLKRLKVIVVLFKSTRRLNMIGQGAARPTELTSVVKTFSLYAIDNLCRSCPKASPGYRPTAAHLSPILRERAINSFNRTISNLLIGRRRCSRIGWTDYAVQALMRQPLCDARRL